MSKGIIISGFAGIGKTTLGKKYKNVIDLESSNYSSIYDDNFKLKDSETRKGQNLYRRPNPDWPDNYVKEIIKKANEYDIILVSQSKDLRKTLDKYGINYILCFPKIECKKEYIKRYYKRNNIDSWIEDMDKHFEKWIEKLVKEPKEKLILKPNETLEDALLNKGYKLETY